ncbi:DUF4129 domain-containing protein [Neobacillus kokaensis]|uniref:DUF4129 domain-containing protein n=1 Tax=Neobacillus kokaensis TaxID=2759023 RepID=A0ABQ3N2A0_9BACI|nr:DUF4129 domain-containing protein [Neobacillus kokaensis]GHH99068.1 hypothetical protein AM1BK_26110 [Neobacillus kokaensis]
MLDANKARDELKDILNQKEYRVYDESKGLFATWWDNAKQWIADKLEDLFPSVNIADSAAGSILLIIVIVVVLLLLAISAYFLIRNHRRNKVLRKHKPLQSRNELNWSYSQHVREAERLEALSDFTGAVRHLFLGLLLFFHEKGWLEARFWKTNWEYYEELRKIDQSRAEQFFHLAQFFDEVTYGEREVKSKEYIQFYENVMKELKEDLFGGGSSVEKG